VSFNDAEEMALVFTHQRRVITRLKKNPSAVLLEEGVFERSRWARFALPKNLISFRSKKRVFSEQERAKRAARLAAARNGHFGNDFVDSYRDSRPAGVHPATGSCDAADAKSSTPMGVSTASSALGGEGELG